MMVHVKPPDHETRDARAFRRHAEAKAFASAKAARKALLKVRRDAIARRWVVHFKRESR